jgi:hypothetical protein
MLDSLELQRHLHKARVMGPLVKLAKKQSVLHRTQVKHLVPMKYLLSILRKEATLVLMAA